MNILVTGGAGFIGSHVIDFLIERGDSVICIDSFDNSYDVEIKVNNIEPHSTNRNFRVYKCDVKNMGALNLIFENEKIDKIIHLAATTGIKSSIENPLNCFESNINGAVILLEMAKKFKIKNFVFASSSAVYGNVKGTTFTEDEELLPLSPYGAAKIASEKICYAYHKLYNIPVTCLRLFTVYGPRVRPHTATYDFANAIINNETVKIYGDGESKRDFVYVSDVVDGIISAVDLDLPFEIINLGTSEVVSVNKVLSLISKELGKEVKIEKLPKREGESDFTQANLSKAKNLLNYEPKVKIEDGIKKFVSWFLENKK